MTNTICQCACGRLKEINGLFNLLTFYVIEFQVTQVSETDFNAYDSHYVCNSMSIFMVNDMCFVSFINHLIFPIPNTENAE